MITANRYLNQIDHTWYDSSNIVYSKFYDNDNIDKKTLKIVFKNGRTYLYKDVDPIDYSNFKLSYSSGEGFNKYIKKYSAARIADTNLEELEKLRESFEEDVKEKQETKMGEMVYTIEFSKNSKEFLIRLDDKTLFKGEDENFSIYNLFQSLNIKYIAEPVDKIINESDELLEKINLDE